MVHPFGDSATTRNPRSSARPDAPRRRRGTSVSTGLRTSSKRSRPSRPPGRSRCPPGCCAPGTARSSVSCSPRTRDGCAASETVEPNTSTSACTTVATAERRRANFPGGWRRSAPSSTPPPPRSAHRGPRALRRRLRRDAAVREGPARPSLRRRQSQRHDRRPQRRPGHTRARHVAFKDLARHDELLGIAFVGRNEPYRPLAEHITELLADTQSA